MNRKSIILVITAIIALCGAYYLGRRQSILKMDDTSGASQTKSTITSGEDVKNIVTYQLPRNWKEFRCADSGGAVYISPDGNGDCNNDKTTPVSISIDAANNTDCNQLQNVSNVSKHTCISLYINSHKSLKSETRYNQQSSYKTDTTLLAYYINTGKGVVKVVYTYTTDNKYEAGWDDLAKTVNTK